MLTVLALELGVPAALCLLRERLLERRALDIDVPC